MKFKGRRRARSGPNLTPLIDVVFLLLVFFMLTAHFVSDEAIPVALPEATTATAVEDTETPTVVIAADGSYLFHGRKLGRNQLTKDLAEALRNREAKGVRIRGDRGTNLGAAVTLIDIARIAGADGIEFITEDGDRPTEGAS